MKTTWELRWWVFSPAAAGFAGLAIACDHRWVQWPAVVLACWSNVVAAARLYRDDAP